MEDDYQVVEDSATPVARRDGIALCLSGGGYRAALFHLGAARRLNELGILGRVATITSVSGGSILAAHLLDCLRPWPAEGEVVGDWHGRVAEPFYRFAHTNIRTMPVLRAWMPWNWRRRSTGVDALARLYEQRLTALRLSDLPPRPRFVFCATDMQFGVNWVFEGRRMGDYMAGYMETPPDWSVGRAVAASSCFPPVFDPMALGLEAGQLRGGNATSEDRERLVPRLSLTDGGLYDNMGLEPVWRSHAKVLVSDGGGVFDYEADWNPIARILRYNTIQSKQSTAIRQRWLVAGFRQGTIEGTYWGIGSGVEDYETDGYTQAVKYSKQLAARTVARIRTDLDAFSDAEIAALENHGYLLANAAVQRRCPTLAAVPDAPLQPPHPDWMDEAKLAVALRRSHKRTLLGRW